MNYRDFFDKALSEAYTEAPLADDKTFVGSIYERAKNMKKDDNVKQMQFTEITPEYIEPKKSAKILHAAAVITGAAAVLTGAVFGLNWLGEHGGLKERGIESSNGAGYHEDITMPLSADTSETEDNANNLATFVYDDFTVNITGYDFDGISLKVYYDTIFPDDCTLSSGERLASVLPMAIFTEENTAEGYGELILETENTQSCIFRETLEEYTESLKVDFKPNKQGYTGSGGYPYTVYADHKSPGISGEELEETKRMLDNYEKLRDIESSPLYTPADEWFDCDGKRVHVTGYAFDTVNLRIRYETCYDEPIKKTSSAAYFYQITNVFPDNSAGCSSADISYDRAEEGIVETVQNIYATEPVDSLEVPFGDSFFSVSYNSNIPKIEREINKEVSGSIYYRFDRFVLTPYSLSFIVTDGPTGNTEEARLYSRTVAKFEVAINLADGSTKEMLGAVDEPSGIPMPDGKAYKFYQFLDPIDINDVVSITVNGCEIYNCERALELGKEFALADGSKGIVNSVQYDGHVCKAEMELRSTDPEYYEHKSYKSKDDPSYSIFLGAHSTITKACGSGKIEISSDENGSIIKYTCFFVPLDKDDTLKLYIGDLTNHIERRAGYVEVPLTVPRHEPIKTVTENDEFGRWEITLSPMGFVIEKDGSDFFLDPKNTDCTVVFTDGREETHTMLSTGHYDKYSSYEYTFGVFDEPLDLDNIHSVSLYGQTIVLGETAD